MRILIAEDDPITGTCLERDLQNQGFEVFRASNGQEALELAEAEDIRLVLTDWSMPTMDGLELCQALRSRRNKSIYRYLIMITARSESADREKAIAAKVDDFLTKPYDQIELRTRLEVARRALDMQDHLQRKNDELTEIQDQLVEANIHLTEATEIAEFARNRSYQLFEDLPVAGFTFDSGGVVFEWNRRAEYVFGVSAPRALGSQVGDLLGPGLVGEKERRQIRSVFEGHEFSEQPWSDGSRYFLVSSHGIRGRDQEVVGAVMTAVDVTEQRRAEIQIERQRQDLVELNGRLKALAVTDGLTGIPNHRAFQDRLHSLTSRDDDGSNFTMAMADVDHFKHFNDTYGHQAGDKVLHKTAECLASNLRGSDFIARYGGEEFAILFEGIGEERALQLCDRLRQRIEEIETPYSRITASFGVATYRIAANNPEALIVAADTALYEAKRRGRNRVCGHSELAKAA